MWSKEHKLAPFKLISTLKKDVFDTFYVFYVQCKRYINDIINTLALSKTY